MVSGEPGGGLLRDFTEPPGDAGPTVLRLLLGAQLRKLREAKHISLEDAGRQIRASHSKMSRLELGRVGFKDRDLTDLLALYGVTGRAEIEALRALGKRANAQGWWHDYSDVLEGWFEAYVGLEEAASRIRAYELQFVPGLLQTPEYGSADGAEIDRRVSLRMARQALLDSPRAPHLWVVLDEAVLRRPVGRPDVMRGQLRHLLACAQRPGITLQVLPFGVGGHAAAGGPFSILRFAEPDLPDIVYLEQLTSALYLDRREAVEHYIEVMDRLCVSALPAQQSTEMIANVLGVKL
jgi:transcriptional regulator with XRE-family HTH domain